MKNIKRLEEAVDQLESNYRKTPGFKPAMTINEKAIADVANKLYWMDYEKRQEEQRHRIEMAQLARREQNLHTAALILSGKSGFLRCRQGWAGLKSGFTCLQEITNKLLEPMVDVSLDKMSLSFGMELWAIDERGMMTLIDAVRDSSD